MIRYLLLAIVIAMVGCQTEPPPPRPRAFPRIDFPEHQYAAYKVAECPYSFGFPTYGEIRDKEEACWFDIYMSKFNARIHCSYIPLKNEAEFRELVRDAFVIATKINERANYMTETRIQNAQGVGGLMLDWSGPAASPVHFYLSDTTSHFFKAALYFDARVQPDSLAPIVAFIKEDIDKIVASFTWQK